MGNSKYGHKFQVYVKTGMWFKELLMSQASEWSIKFNNSTNFNESDVFQDTAVQQLLCFDSNDAEQYKLSHSSFPQWHVKLEYALPCLLTLITRPNLWVSICCDCCEIVKVECWGKKSLLGFRSGLSVSDILRFQKKWKKRKRSMQGAVRFFVWGTRYKKPVSNKSRGKRKCRQNKCKSKQCEHRKFLNTL